jgi:Flp pilus assembly protein TadG
MLTNNFLARVLNRQGQSVVEISLITPLLLVALYIPADFGIAFFTAHLTQNAVREAARMGSSREPFDTAASIDIKNYALTAMPNRLTSKAVTVSYYADGSADCARFVEVVGQGNYNFFLYQIMRLFGATVPDAHQITRTVRMRHQSQPTIYNTPCTTATVTSP